MELILEKTTIPSQIPRLARPRLLAMLRSSLESCTSTVISGRAGAGKTALATDFARICGRSVAWYKVDATDLELRVFFAYLVASIRQQRPAFNEQNIMSLVGTAKSDHILLLAETFVYELLEGEGNPLLIVIEDLHQVCDAEWLVPFLRRFLPLLPRDVHVLITSRTLPSAPLWRMRSKQTLEVIDEATLAFTREEAVELFETYGLSGEHARVAFDRTHGRAAALAAHAVAFSKSRTAHENRPNDPVARRLADQKRALRLVDPICLATDEPY
jgi:LuxR family maltose regulon positive regulatory protein